MRPADICIRCLLLLLLDVLAISDMVVSDEADGHITADEMDENRKKQMAYEYLCHLEEAKKYGLRKWNMWYM